MHLPTAPELFILIPCFNDQDGLVQAIEGIDFPPEKYRVVVVDDGSHPPLPSAELQERLAPRQLHFIKMPFNSGITRALNAGLTWILDQPSCRYIARLDCRDLCDSRRFRLQTAYLDNHPEVGLLGSWCIFRQASSGISYTYKTPTDHASILKEMPLRNVFIHPTVMFRPEVVRRAGLYPEAYPYVEDYAFFWNLLKISKGAVLPDFLVTCAITESGISLSNRRKQLIGRKKVINAFAGKTFAKRVGLIKINFLMIIPKALLLRLKSLISKN